MESPIHVFRQSNLRLVWISRRRFEEASLMKGAAFLPFRIWHLEEGSAFSRFEGRTMRLRAGDWACLPMAFDEQVVAKNSLLTTLALQWEFPDGRQPLQELATSLLQPPHTAISACVRALLDWATVDGVEPGFDHHVDDMALESLAFAKYQQLLWALLEEVLRITKSSSSASILPLTGKNPDARAAGLSAVLREHAEKSFPEKAALEGQFGLSWRRLEQLFHTFTGTTPHCFHTRLRAERARGLLLDRRFSIKQIAFQLEFPSVSAFSQWFKASHKTGPANYRRRAWM